MTCIIYWQANEINRVILEKYPENACIDLSGSLGFRVMRIFTALYLGV